jgi:hypothetical protein
MPLDFVRLKEQHPGMYSAENFRLMVEKFGVQERVSSHTASINRTNTAV